MDNNNILIPFSIIANSPSRIDGISAQVELSHRILGCEIIQQGGIMLKFPQVVSVTAQNIFHRLYYR